MVTAFHCLIAAVRCPFTAVHRLPRAQAEVDLPLCYLGCYRSVQLQADE